MNSDIGDIEFAEAASREANNHRRAAWADGWTYVARDRVSLTEMEHADSNLHQQAEPHSHSSTLHQQVPGEEGQICSQRMPRETSLEKHISRLLRRIGRLDRSRERVLVTRKELMYARKEYRNHQAFADESQRAFLARLDDIYTTDDVNTVRTQLHELYGQCRGDLLALKDQSNNIQSLENTLSKLEYSMQRQERSLAHAADSVRAHIQRQDPQQHEAERLYDFAIRVPSTDDKSISEHGPESIDAPTSNQDPILNNYWDKAGDVNVMKDRLFELDAEHADLLSKRILQEDQGVILPISSEEFDRDYQFQLQIAQAALEEAVRAKERALMACVDEGIDPEEHRPRTSDRDEDFNQKSPVPDAKVPFEDSRVELWNAQVEDDLPPGILLAPGSTDYSASEVAEGREAEPRDFNIEQWIDSIEEDREDHLVTLLEQIGGQDAAKRPQAQPNRYSAPSGPAKQALENNFGEDLNGRSTYFNEIVHSSRSQKLDGVVKSRPSTGYDERSRSSSDSQLATLRKLSTSHPDMIRQLSEVIGQRTKGLV